MENKFWRFERVDYLPEGKRKSFIRDLINDFLSERIAIGKVHGIKIGHVNLIKKIIEKDNIPLAVCVRNGEVYLNKIKG